jgi:TatA/E family protein of Tat protein translocase
MFGSIGMPELIIILTLALIIFGPRKLPELGRSLGKSLGEFKRASNELRNTLDEEIRIEEEQSSAKTAARAEPAPPVVESGAEASDGDAIAEEQPVARETRSA